MPPFEPRIIATAGHIDHGKSTLVEALTGTDTDRLPEEKKRGMTIELGFAHLSLPDPQNPGNGWSAGIVDVPGHADFVRNMVAGVGSVDLALLVVASDDGWMPQTEEHFQILLHLGVTRGVVALTKSDLLADGGAVAESIREQLAGTTWAGAPIVPVCAIGGNGLEELREALTNILRVTPAPADCGKPRLHVDRVFSPRGAGTVVTGTLSGGVFRTGEEIVVQPCGLAGKIRGLQNHNRPQEIAHPGMRTAVQLGGIEIARDGIGSGVWRGHTIAAGAAGRTGPSTVIHVHLQRLGRGNTTAPLRHGQKVWLHHGTSSHEARVYLAETRQLAPGESGIGELRTRSPVFAFAGDRFVLRDFSRRHTLAGGTVLDPMARARAWKQERCLNSLRQRAAHPHDVVVWMRDLIGRDGGFQTAGLFLQSAFGSAEINAALSALTGIERCEGWVIAAERWEAALGHSAEMTHAFHGNFPSSPGLKLADLRTAVMPHLPDANLFDRLVESLGRRGFVRGQGLIHAANFVPVLSPAVLAARDKIRAVLGEDKCNPPKLSNYAQSAEEKEAVPLLLRNGEAFHLNDDIVMLVESYEILKQLIVAHLRSQGRDTVAGMRDAIGGTRRILVPVCERMDRERITLRNGDWRSLAGKL